MTRTCFALLAVLFCAKEAHPSTPFLPQDIVRESIFNNLERLQLLLGINEKEAGKFKHELGSILYGQFLYKELQQVS